MKFPRLFGRPDATSIKRFAFPKSGSVADDLRDGLGYSGDLLDIYTGNRGAVVHKWHHYLPLYDRYFTPFRNRPLRFLEIGVSKGGSLQMWRNYFGPEAVIFGIDIDPACEAYNGQAGQVRIGSQDDPAFLRDVVAEMGGVDLVLDDGSHRMEHIRASLEVLFPLLSDGGVYMIEDLHTAFWSDYGGGLGSEGNFFEEVRQMVDDMHHWYHGNQPGHPERASWLTGIHLHDSIVVLDKQKVRAPVHSKIGGR